jgi:hypothetical protein
MIDYAMDAPDYASCKSILVDALDGVNGAENYEEVKGERETLQAEVAKLREELANKHQEIEKHLSANHRLILSNADARLENQSLRARIEDVEGMAKVIGAQRSFVPEETATETTRRWSRSLRDHLLGKLSTVEQPSAYVALLERVAEAARKYSHADGLGDRYTFLEWFADRCVRVYGESENVDFVIAAREKGRALQAALRALTGK